jgi:hypothetical protein
LLHVITLTHTTFGMTPLDKGSVCRTGLYLTTPNTHKTAKRQPAIPASERPQTHAFDRAATGIGLLWSSSPLHLMSTRADQQLAVSNNKTPQIQIRPIY